MKTPSIWHKTAAPCPDLPKLAGTAEVEIGIIGAGVAGLSTALHLAEAGVSVALVEAESPGAGSTQASGGLVVPDFVSHTPNSLSKKTGKEEGLRLAKFVGTSATRTFSIIQRHGLDCAPRQEGFFTPAHSERVAASLQTRAKEWQRLGLDVNLVVKEETARLLGTDFYPSAIRYASGGTVNPLALARELARKAIELGAAIFANSPVQQPVHRNGHWHIETPEGKIVARRLVLAANGGNAALHPAMRATTMPFDIVGFATEPVSDSIRTRILPEGGCYTDKQPNLFTLRFDVKGRLISGFAAFLRHRSQDFLARVSAARLQRFYPALADIAIEQVWLGTAQINSSLLPQVYDLGEGAIAIQACNGRGLAVNTSLGAEVGRYLASEQADSVLPLPLSRPRPIRAYAAARFLPAVAMVFARLGNA